MAKKRVEIELLVDGKKATATLTNIDSVAKSLAKSSRTALQTMSNIGNIATGMYSVYRIGTQVVNVAQQAIDAYKVQEQAEKKLATALGHTSEELLNYASAMQKVTTHGDEEIIQAQALIAAFVKDEEQIKLLTKATLDLADAKGMSLTAAADLVSKTIGSSTNALSRYGIEVKGAVDSTERLNSLLENINEKFGGQAEALAQTETGKLQQAYNQLGDSMERVGQIAAKIITPVTTMIANITAFAVDGMFPAKDAMTKMTEAAAEQMAEFDLLANRYLTLKENAQRTNEQQKIFEETIKKLNEKYPNYLKNVDLYSDAYEDVKTALDGARESLDNYTQAMIKKAVLEKKQKEIVSLMAQIIELEKIKIDNEAAGMKEMIETSSKYDDEYAVMIEKRKEIVRKSADDMINMLKGKIDEFKEDSEILRKLIESMFAPPKEDNPIEKETEKIEKNLDKQIEAYARTYDKLKEYYENKEQLRQKDIEEHESYVARMIGYIEEEIEARERSISAAITGFENISAAAGTFYDLQASKENERIENERTSRIERIKSEYAVLKTNAKTAGERMIIEKELQRKIAAINAEAEEKKREAAKGWFTVMKVGSIAAATIKTYEAATTALASAPPPFNYFAAAAVTAAGLANVAQIAAQDIPQFATGVRNFEGGLAVVGERGPELVNLPRGSDVINNFESKTIINSSAEALFRIEAAIREQTERLERVERIVNLDMYTLKEANEQFNDYIEKTGG